LCRSYAKYGRRPILPAALPAQDTPDAAPTGAGKERSAGMNNADVCGEIKELNLAYLMLAQQLIRADRETALFRLGIGADLAELIERLTPGQVLKMAGSNMLLCRLRFDDKLLLGLLSSHGRDCGTAHTHAAILACAKPVEAVA
jgi:flagellar transcriptional activator FlhD